MQLEFSYYAELGIRIAKKKKEVAKHTLLGLKIHEFMNPTGYLTPQESMFQISNQSVKPFNLEVGEHRDIESKNYYVEYYNLETI